MYSYPILLSIGMRYHSVKNWTNTFTLLYSFIVFFSWIFFKNLFVLCFIVVLLFVMLSYFFRWFCNLNACRNYETKTKQVYNKTQDLFFLDINESTGQKPTSTHHRNSLFKKQKKSTRCYLNQAFTHAQKYSHRSFFCMYKLPFKLNINKYIQT